MGSHWELRIVEVSTYLRLWEWFASAEFRLLSNSRDAIYNEINLITARHYALVPHMLVHMLLTFRVLLKKQCLL